MSARGALRSWCPLLFTAVAAVSGPAFPAEYRVGAGDVLKIEVNDEPDLSRSFAVDETGTVHLPLVGSRKVQGLSASEIADDLREELRRFVKTPSVQVSVAEFHSQKVYVIGAVVRPGTQSLKGNETLLDVLLAAGGQTDAARGELLVLCANGRPPSSLVVGDGAPEVRYGVSTIAVRDLVDGVLKGNVEVHAGDVIYVAGAPDVVEASATTVTVAGEVTRPGVFRLEQGGTVLAAIFAAGGATRSASLNRARIIRVRKGVLEEIPVELGDILKRGDRRKDVPLEPGDMVIVPRRIF